MRHPRAVAGWRYGDGGAHCQNRPARRRRASSTRRPAAATRRWAQATCAMLCRLRPITAPRCRSGAATPPRSGKALSAEAIADPPPFGRARSAVVYTALARALIGRLKYRDRPELAAFCARLMVEAGAELWAGAPVLAPVPLHPLRLLSRRHNQSTELARRWAATGLAVVPGLVARRRNTRPQVGLSGTARRRNLAGAFAVRPRRCCGSRAPRDRRGRRHHHRSDGARREPGALDAGAAAVDVVTSRGLWRVRRRSRAWARQPVRHIGASE